jgi:hypothetical protein
MAFAGTKSAILAAVAALLLPDGLGNIQIAQSPPQFDNSLNVATTSFVRQLGMQSASVISNSAASFTPGLAAIGSTVISTVAGAGTLNLPVLSSVPAGARIEILNFGTGTLALAATGGNGVINNGAASVASYPLLAGDTVTLVSNGSNVWMAVDGAGQLKGSGSFGASLAANGYQKLPSGLIFQWGRFNGSGSADTPVTYPIAFPNAALSLNVTSWTASGAGSFGTTTGTGSLTGFSGSTWASSTVRLATTGTWIAIGN